MIFGGKSIEGMGDFSKLILGKKVLLYMALEDQRDFMGNCEGEGLSGFIMVDMGVRHGIEGVGRWRV